MVERVTEINKPKELANWLGQAKNDGETVRTKLQASERVIARVTDGIYRQPASALRELISNAWDADANNVTILTDAPRFSRIYVRDDGAGMSNEVLARLLKSIGGSAKRREEGKGLGITDSHDVDRTPGGRLLIGKIGIGLFSVSQLARRFQIVTKVKGADYQLVAEIALRAYSDNADHDAATESDDAFISGEVLLRREKAKKNAHGTDIILHDLKPPVRELLRSAARWKSLEEKREALASNDLESALSNRTEEPVYHSGFIDQPSKSADAPDVLTIKPKLPWKEEDPPEVRMAKLVEAVGDESSRLERPDLATTLDTYLETIWTLGLSAPVRYVDSHPFDLTGGHRIKLFWITEGRGKGEEIRLKKGQTVREAIKETAPGHPVLQDGKDTNGGFRVLIDGLELRRPIRFKFQKTEKRGLNNAYLFVGKYAPNLAKVSPSQRGGELSLEGYLFWTGRVVPKENNGVLVRIRGAGGALFDPTFFKYQVAELTRLKQITSELFVHRGLDAALNIDRESFNFAHPHFGLVSRYLHSSIKQLTNRLKDEAKTLAQERKDQGASADRDKVTSVARAAWRTRHGTSSLPDIAIVDTESQARAARQDGSIAVVRQSVPLLQPATARAARDAQAIALMQVLEAYGVLEDRTYKEQQELVRAIFEIFLGSAK